MFLLELLHSCNQVEINMLKAILNCTAISLMLLILSGCALTQKAGQLAGIEHKPEIEKSLLQEELDQVPAPLSGKLVAAVYNFKDLTGQRRATPTFASFSTAVTQGAEPFLISALQTVGKGQWFDVVERVNVDDLIKERTIIKQMREAYEGKNAIPLPPLQCAGILMEGGIVGYDSSTDSGGAAYQWLGIGPQTQYSKDTVTISLRAVSVASGKILTEVTVTKTIYSTADSVAILKTWQNGTQFFQAESGLTINEPGTRAVKTTVEAAVIELLKQGAKKGIWSFQTPVSK